MDEATWLASTDPQAMLTYLRTPTGASRPAMFGSKCGDRKLRLFACACCRQVWDKLNESAHHAVIVAELFADGVMTSEDIEYAEMNVSVDDMPTWIRHMPLSVCQQSINWPQFLQRCHRGGIPHAVETHLLRDIIGNPFQRIAWGKPTDIGDGWTEYDCRAVLTHNDGAVVKLAEIAYAERCAEPLTLAMLADALEEAGCPDSEECDSCHAGYVANLDGGVDPCVYCHATRRIPNSILSHLRGPGPHARGCWVVDLILGKT